MNRLIPDIILESYRCSQFSGAFDAASVSVDISGFTGIAETLMQQGESGAEILTGVLNQVLSPLIEEVYTLGGFVATFAGDSITALFPDEAGNDTSLLSLRIAQSTLRSFGAVSTPLGTFELGARIGLSRGKVEFGIPGVGSRYTYYFKGPGIQSCARAVANAKTGEILITEELLCSVGSAVETVWERGFHRITGFRSSLDGKKARQMNSGQAVLPLDEELSHFVQDRVIDLVKSGARAEFRRVTASFICFDDSMDDSRVNRFVSSVLKLADEYGGFFNKLLFGEQGAVILVLFGAPQTHENDCERTADFILALKQREPLVRWMAGSAFGMVYAGLIGCEERCEYTSIGDVVNLAARIAQQKDWGELRLNQELAMKLKDTHELHLVDNFSFKGKQAPQPVYRLTERKSAADSSIYSGLMVGRLQELNMLEDWLAPVLQGGFGGIMYIHGDAGIGKSRLAEEFHRRLCSPNPSEAFAGEDSGREVQWFPCPADEILRKSLNPFKHFLRSYFNQQRNLSQKENLNRFNMVLRDLVGSLASSSDPRTDDLVCELERTHSFLGAMVDLYWPDALYTRLEPKLRFPNTLLSLKALFKAESLRSPVILLMEDVQWLDADSLELFQMLTRNLDGYPLAFICTARYKDDGTPVTLSLDSNVQQSEIELQPLSEDAVRYLIHNHLEANVSDELSCFVLEKTASNPFFVEQLLLDLRERGVLKFIQGDQSGNEGSEGRPSAGKWILDRTASEIPNGINAVLLARLDRLTAEVRHTVQTAAVLGREFPVQVLSMMLKDDASVLQNVKKAESARIWTALNEFRYLFRHALFRDAAYQMQMRSRLQSLHLAAAEAMEKVYGEDLSPHYSELTYHFGQADYPDRECHYAVLAGNQAADTFANQEALAYLNRAIELTPGSKARFNLMSTRERVYDLLGMRTEQVHELESMKNLADSLDEPQLVAHAVLRRSQYAADTSDYSKAIESARKCIAIVKRTDPPAELVATGVKARNVWGISLMSQGKFEQAREKLEETLEMAVEIKDRAQQVTVLGNLGMLHALRGSFDSARECWSRGLDLCREVDDLLHETAILLNLGNAAFSQCDLVLAGRNWEKALSIFQEIGYRTGAAHALLNLGVLSYQMGSYLQAKIHYEQALFIARETDDRQIQGMALGNLGNLLTQVGEYTGARDSFLKALAIRRGIGDQQGEGIVLGYLCHLEMLVGSFETAEDFGRRSLSITREIGDRPYQAKTLSYLGQALASQGCIDEACESFQMALDLYQELGQQGLAIEPKAWLAQTAVSRGEPGKAMRFVEEILEYLENNSPDSTGDPFSVYLACFDALKANEDNRAEDILIVAVSQLRERALRIQDERLRSSFLENVAANRRIMELTLD